jgi:hypothetical protein
MDLKNPVNRPCFVSDLQQSIQQTLEIDGDIPVVILIKDNPVTIKQLGVQYDQQNKPMFYFISDEFFEDMVTN